MYSEVKYWYQENLPKYSNKVFVLHYFPSLSVWKDTLGKDHLYSFCLLFLFGWMKHFQLQKWLKWTTLYNEQAELFFSFFGF